MYVCSLCLNVSFSPDADNNDYGQLLTERVLAYYTVRNGSCSSRGVSTSGNPQNHAADHSRRGASDWAGALAHHLVVFYTDVNMC